MDFIFFWYSMYASIPIFSPSHFMTGWRDRSYLIVPMPGCKLVTFDLSVLCSTNWATGETHTYPCITIRWRWQTIFDVFQVKCVVETKDSEHAKDLEKLLRAHYHHVQFGPHVIWRGLFSILITPFYLRSQLYSETELMSNDWHFIFMIKIF